MEKKTNEWYTPACYIEAARRTMGGIDLDPASCAVANETVKARRYYTKEDDGLHLPWDLDRIWLNPPYGRVIPGSISSNISYQKLFVEKLIREYERGTFKQAIALLLGNACYNSYFKPLWKYPLCFHSGHIKFQRIDGKRDSYGFGTIFAYLGDNQDAFAHEFGKFGHVVCPWPALASRQTLLRASEQ
jgi:ParB family chromosome partitioning protein